MNPSDGNKPHRPPSSGTKMKFFPGAAVLLVIVGICGLLFSYMSPEPEPIEPPKKNFSTAALPPGTTPETNGQQETALESGGDKNSDSTVHETSPGRSADNQVPHPGTLLENREEPLPNQTGEFSKVSTPKAVSSCDKPTQQLNTFYTQLDKQAYMTKYDLPTSSQEHFTTLINKLLSNPPQVARESDDLYTILKNTAHFFRICGKDNIFMMKGILDNEKGNLEQILADYYHLVTTADCSQTTYASDIDNDALYEYACFFLNTMGGRLYLFRRDSQSRMVVTYYAILLIDQANKQKNNHHGITIKPSVDMLIAEMESGGSALKRLDYYLDTLYDLKERYQ